MLWRQVLPLVPTKMAAHKICISICFVAHILHYESYESMLRGKCVLFMTAEIIYIVTQILLQKHGLVHVVGVLLLKPIQQALSIWCVQASQIQNCISNITYIRMESLRDSILRTALYLQNYICRVGSTYIMTSVAWMLERVFPLMDPFSMHFW